jgi:tRNA-specific 2-thiouridylase
LNFLQFPLGHMTKPQVREHAKRLGLPTAEKQESQEICFVDDKGYAATVERILGHGGQPGVIIHEDGKVLGTHQGVHHFTLGQRKGLGVSSDQPLYVTHIDAEKGEVRVGSKASLGVQHVVLHDVVWALGEAPSPSTPVQVQQRYRGPALPAHIETLGAGSVRVCFEESVVPGAPGQAAVVYQEGVVLGGGVIARSSRPLLRVLPSEGAHV